MVDSFGYTRYRGYLLKLIGPRQGGYWLIFDNSRNLIGSADYEELNQRIEEIEAESIN